ncbi:dnaJ homolog subfamily C member 11 isoform X2 [Nematostella vectensis]|uniref:dnaJ homolog subfamily C member 11 isoform X2 n=1 Tax=Nematostella vectensis TaxID=45351 RepID=UPI002077180E|nr:dnaJ homolog subfamily C member 11 isoform X2 [Nematostella vectensis]
MAPSYANLFMAKVEKEIIDSSPVKPYLWRRYIDDIFMIWTEGIPRARPDRPSVPGQLTVQYFKMADAPHDESEDEVDYYAVLAVRKEANEDELKAAYRRLCVLYHPDKHTDPEKKRVAVQLFSKVQKAYEVLSDPETKAIYDVYGQKGLDAGWEVIERRRTPAEIQAEYERLQREKEERRLQQRTNPKGSVIVGVDATDLFDHYEGLEERGLPNIEVSNMAIMQSIEAPLTRMDTATLSGSLGVRNGNGSGSVALSMRRVLSYKAWGEVEVGAGDGPTLTFRGFRNLTKRSYATSGVTMQVINGTALSAGLQTMVARQLDKHTVGYLTWKAGAQSSMNTTVIRETEDYRAVLTLQLGVPNTFGVASVTKKLEETRLKLAIKGGIFGMIFEYGIEKKISQHSQLGASISIGVPTGVTLKIKLTRATQVYSFPVSLSEQISPAAIFYGTIAPVVVFLVAKVLVVSPFKKQEQEKEEELNREKHAQQLAKKKQEAEDTINLMRESYERNLEFESQRHGLVIVHAWYGNLVSMDESHDGQRTVHSTHAQVIDVTVPVQCQVRESRLFLAEGPKHNLSGFYDPCPNQDKLLRIRYEFRDALHEVTIGELETIRIPKQSHRMEAS